FVPFIRDLIAHLTSRRVPGGTSTAGEPVVFLAPDAERADYDLVKPLKKDQKQRERVKLEITDGSRGPKATVTATDTLRAGIYNITQVGKPDNSGVYFAVNPDLRET